MLDICTFCQIFPVISKLIFIKIILIEVCTEAVMKFGDIKLLLDWSWNTSEKDRLKEAAVYRHVWKKIQQMLTDHF